MTTHQRRRYEDDDDKHILRDQERLRVPLTMSDSEQRTIAEKTCHVWDSVRRSEQRAFVHDGSGNSNSLGLHKPGPRYLSDGSVVDEREAAYQWYDSDIQRRWMGDGGEAKAGDECTINGAPGHLKVVGNRLECIADDPKTNPGVRRGTAHTDSVNTSMADHATRMAEIYKNYDADISTRWAKGK